MEGALSGVTIVCTCGLRFYCPARDLTEWMAHFYATQHLVMERIFDCKKPTTHAPGCECGSL